MRRARRCAKVRGEMATTRRIGAEDSTTRAALLDAAQRLMLAEGYAAVTSRRVAAEADLKPQLVHYYFRTMDDLFLALFRRGADQNLERQAAVLASPQPLRALWEFSSERAGAALTMEFVALANHRPAIRAEIAAYAATFRRQQAEALTPLLAEYGIDVAAFPPMPVLVFVQSLSRLMAIEEGIGLTAGHDETRELVERFLTRLEGPPQQP